MTIEGTHRTALRRQITEAVNLAFTEADYIMNSKSEWNGSKIPRVMVGVPGKTTKYNFV